jgi:molybdopterin/thiamine biosynthesis adenylyltransferase
MSLATAIPFIFRKQKEVKKRTKSKWYVLNKLPSCKREKLYDEIINQIRIQDLQKPKRTNIRFNDFKATCFIAVIFPEETVSGEKGWGWLFLIDGEIVKIDGRNQINGKAVRQNTNLILPILSLDKQDYSQRAPVSDVLNGKTISIVGLGTLGAPSAIEFAKNGVSKLKLLDYDFIDTSSTIRWPLGMEYAGMTKTMALKHFIEANFPFTEVEVVNHKIGSTNQILYGQEHLKLNWLFEDCSLLYDASAEEGVNNLLSGISLKHSIPYVSLEARRGGWGGIIARILPKTTKGCWMCLQYHLVDGNISPPREDLKGGIQPRGCGDISFTGASFDLQNISLGGVKVSIKSLENSDDYMDSDVFVVNMVDDSELGIMPQWEKHTLLKHKNCPICNK